MLSRKAGIFNTPVYSSCTNLGVKYQVSLYELRSALPYLDPDISMGNWKFLIDLILSIYPQATDLFIKFLTSIASPPSSPPVVVASPPSSFEVLDYTKKRKRDEFQTTNMNMYYGKLYSLIPYVKEEHKHKFQNHIKRLECKEKLPHHTLYFLGQLKIDLFSSTITSPSQLIDNTISIFRNKVYVYNDALYTSRCKYNYTEARKILGLYTLDGRDYDILNIITICPYFQATEEIMKSITFRS